MDARSEIRAFLTSRRARIAPERVGLGTGGDKRRGPGLRRAEVAVLAGVSVDYYNRLERGQVGGVSDHVLEALSEALQLDEAERTHLLALVQATRTATRQRPAPAPLGLRPNVRHVLDAIAAPALLHNRCLDILAANPLGRAVHAPILASAAAQGNHARYLFLDPGAREFYVDWETVAGGTVPLLRAGLARHPDDQALADLVEELSAASAAFRSWWATQDVRFFGSATPVPYRHPVVGDLTLTFEALQLVLERGLTIAVYTPVPGSASERALADLAATLDG